MDNDNLARRVATTGPDFGGVLASITRNELSEVSGRANVDLKSAAALVEATGSIAGRHHGAAQAGQAAVKEDAEKDLLDGIGLVVAKLGGKVDAVIVVGLEVAVKLVGLDSGLFLGDEMLKTVEAGLGILNDNVARNAIGTSLQTRNLGETRDAAVLGGAVDVAVDTGRLFGIPQGLKLSLAILRLLGKLPDMEHVLQNVSGCNGNRAKDCVPLACDDCWCRAHSRQACERQR